MMPLYGLQNLTDVCVYKREIECETIPLCQLRLLPEDVTWTWSSPENQSPFYLWNLCAVFLAKNESIKGDLTVPLLC